MAAPPARCAAPAALGARSPLNPRVSRGAVLLLSRNDSAPPPAEAGVDALIAVHVDASSDAMPAYDKPEPPVLTRAVVGDVESALRATNAE